MGKTYKQKKGSDSNDKNAGGKQKPAKKIKVRGPKPDFAPKHAVMKKKNQHYCESNSWLFNGALDNEIYLLDDVECTKGMFPLFKDAVNNDVLFIIASSIPEFHPLTLACVQSGTR